MSPRIIYLAMLACLLAASSCAIEASAPSDEQVGSQKSTLTTGGGGEVKQVDPSGGTSETTTPDQPGSEDPGAAEQTGEDPGKPSPDPWLRPATTVKGDTVLRGGVDPALQSNLK
jgi:hypothetical protein